jgi:dTDP-glucose 4,6-dehydratase
VYPVPVHRLLVTGGAGFIGSNFIHFLMGKNGDSTRELEVTILDSLTYAGKMENLDTFLNMNEIRFIKGDVRNWELVQDLVEQSDEVIHFAAESHVDRSISNPGIFVDTNVKGTQNLLEACKNFGRRIVLVSTDEVYGSLELGFATESDSLNPSSPYSASKASADLLALAYYKTFGLDVIITRCSNNYGPRQHTEKLIPLTIKRSLSGQNIPIYGNGKNIRDWIHVEDHCLGIYLALTSGNAGSVYNFGDVEQATNLEIVKLILNLMNKSESLIEFVEDRPGHDFRYAIDSSLAKNFLGWKPKKRLKTDLIEVIEWYVNQRH